MRTNKGGFLPESYDIAHDMCFVIHDVIVAILKSGEEGSFFNSKINFEDDADRISFENSKDVFDWLENKNRIEDRAEILKRTVLPAVLSDMMHCIYEALETSRNAKLNISYMLIRKPIQESLYLLEALVVDKFDFSEKLATEPLKLRAQKVGGVDVHYQRIQKVLEKIGENHRFDASYLAQIRYDKSKEDSFDGICNHAMHLFTEHEAIRTDPLNINFIFSGWESKLTQWSYLYSRLPYVLFYIHRVVEYVVADIAPTDPEYLHDVDRRISALTLLWWEYLEDDYKTEQSEKLVKETRNWLNAHCLSVGYSSPNEGDLIKMSSSGAYPSESIVKVKIRNLRYSLQSKFNKLMANSK